METGDMQSRKELNMSAEQVSAYAGKVLRVDLTARKITVRLQVPTAHHMPLTTSHEPPDSFEERRIVLFDPLVELDLIAVEDEALELLAQVAHGAGQCQGLTDPLGPLPEPDRVEMRIANKMYFSFFLHTQFHFS